MRMQSVMLHPFFSRVGPSPPERSEERRKNRARTGLRFGKLECFCSSDSCSDDVLTMVQNGALSCDCPAACKYVKSLDSFTRYYNVHRQLNVTTIRRRKQ